MIRLAITDDHRLFRQGIWNLIQEAEGLTPVFQAANGRELLDQLPENPVDVVLLDLEMPVLGGLDTLKVLKSEYPEIGVIVLSMHEEDHVLLHLMEQGADGYLTKDVEPEELETAIREVRGKGQYFSRRVSELMLRQLRRETAPSPPSNSAEIDLNEREREVLQLLCEGCTTPEIADQLCLSPRTIDGYRKSLLEKTQMKNVAALVAWAFRKGRVE